MTGGDRRENSRRFGGGARGFTLVEAAATVSVIAVVAAVVLPFYSGFLKETRLNAAADEAENALAYARDMAIRSGLRCRVTFDEETDSLLVERLVRDEAVMDTTRTYVTRGEALARTYVAAEHPIRPDRSYRLFFPAVRRFEGAEIAESDFDGADTVSFDAYGHASATGFVKIALGGDTVAVGVGEFGEKLEKIEQMMDK